MKINRLFAPAILCVLTFSTTLLSAQMVLDTLENDSNISIAFQQGKNALAIDSFDNVWIGYKVGATRWNNGTSTFYNTSNSGLPSNLILSFAFSGSTTWVGTDSGLAKYSNSVWTVYDSLNSGLQNNYIRCLFADGNDLWIGTNGGAFHFDGTTFTNYSTSNSGILKDTIQCIAKASGKVWFGTNEGLSLYSNGVFTNYDTSNSGLYENNILKLVTDGNNELWIQTILIIGVSKNQLHVYHMQNGNSIIPAAEEFTSCKGIPLSEYLIGTDNSGKVILGVTSTIDETQILILNSTSSELSRRNHGFNSFFAPPVNLTLMKLFAVSSGNLIWMILPNYPSARKIYTLDYSGSNPVNLEDKCFQLDVNKVRARINNDGEMFQDDARSNKYEVPVGSGKNALRQSSFWIGALDTNANVRVAASLYDGVDFWPGPLDTTDASVDSLTIAQYDKIWKVHRDTVSSFVYNYSQGNVSNGSYPVPDEINEWPAQGSGSHSRLLAPFVDANNDGVYDPLDGDYPDIKGSEMLWWIFNDNYDVHLLSNSPKNLGIEIHASAYAFNCPNASADDTAINYTTFYHYEIFNRSDTDYTNAYSGIFTEVDLGYPKDDFVGCDTANDFVFAYNGSNNDYGILGYGNNPPMISQLILRGPDAGLNDSIDNNHNGVTDEAGEFNMMNSFMFFNDNNDPVGGNPNGVEDYYGYLKSEWRNGMHLTYGGNGHGGGIGFTNDSSNYMFSGVPFGTGWTETAAGNLPDERRLLSSSGPFYLPAHGKVALDFAYVYSRNETAPNGIATSVATNLHDVLKVKHWFETDTFPCNNGAMGITEPLTDKHTFSIYPNPAEEKCILKRNSSRGSAVIEIIDMPGKRVANYLMPEGNKLFNIDIGSLETGMYFVHLMDGINSSVEKLIVR